MKITCPYCEKKFNVDASLIPNEGRLLQCGSCNREWFYQKEKGNLESLPLEDNIVVEKDESSTIDDSNDNNIESPSHENNIVIEKDEPNIVVDSNDINIKENQTKIDQQDKKITTRSNTKNKKTKKNLGSKFFSYLAVLIISFIALIILLDTFKTPLYVVFPHLETILFNLFETLQDIKLFIIDLL